MDNGRLDPSFCKGLDNVALLNGDLMDTPSANNGGWVFGPNKWKMCHKV